MSWHYQIRRNEDKGQVWYSLVEMNDCYGGGTGPATPSGRTPQEVIEALEIMLADATEYPVLEEDGADG